MTAEELRELINRDVDGDLSPSEHRQLAQALRRNASARRLFADIKALGATLSSVRQADPPANLGNRIRAEVRSSLSSAAGHRTAPAGTPTSGGWAESLRRLWGSPSMVRYGTVFAGGLVTGAFLFMVLIHPQPAPSVSGDAATGSLIMHSESFPVNVQGAQGTITAIPTETGKEVTLRLTCGVATTTTLRFDPSRVKLENVRDVQSAGGPVVVNQGAVELTGTGVQKCTLLFSGVKDSKISVQVASTGGGTFRTEVQVH